MNPFLSCKHESKKKIFLFFSRFHSIYYKNLVQSDGVSQKFLYSFLLTKDKTTPILWISNSLIFKVIERGEEMDFEILNEVNQYLVRIFNEILQIEEESLKSSQFSNVTIKEMHTIEAIGLVDPLTSTEVAKKLGVTAGTLSVSIQNLVKKGYVERVASQEDRRIIRLKLTKEGKLLYRLHHKFHMDMVTDTLTDFDQEEALVLIKALRNLNRFLDTVKERM